ncbi:unnamed protein product [Rotaria socialis]|uniref:Reverse transcriptase n=1 Tax=Rotaria socialis TaxID=392032 RepID=A0A818L539_9BILA|nr:unnamed protein product [Rotaria socialis]CAF4896531.1 unnamed protein product [Rotaria socialis]
MEQYKIYILYSEVEEAIGTLKKNKSPGSDGIAAKMLQTGCEALARQIHELYNRAWYEGTILEEWGKSILVPIPKKGDPSECANYRTRSPSSTTQEKYC